MTRRWWWIAAITWLVPMAATAQASASNVTLTGSISQVTTNPAPQLDPRISGNLVVFTDLRNGNSDVYYVDISSGAEVQVTSSPANQDLYDVNGGTIVYTDYTPGTPVVVAYDVASATGADVGPTTGSTANPGVYGNTVVYTHSDPGQLDTDLWMTDLSTGQSRALTTTPNASETNPSVNAGRVVFERRPLGSTRDIVMLDIATGVETVIAATSADEQAPDIDGNIITWDAIPPGRTDSDVFYYDLSTGTTTELNLPGNQIRARVSGDIMAYDDDSTGSWDVVLYHIPTGFTHRITGAGSVNYLNDVDGNHIVYTSDASGNLDIWMYTFNLTVATPTPTPGGGGGTCNGPTVDACADTSSLTPVWSGTYDRQRGRPHEVTDHFSATPGKGMVVIHNNGCAAAEARFNGHRLLSECGLNHTVDCISHPVDLEEHNRLSVELESKPGCSLTFDVFSVPASACVGDGDHDHEGDDGHHDHCGGDDDGHHRVGHEDDEGRHAGDACGSSSDDDGSHDGSRSQGGSGSGSGSTPGILSAPHLRVPGSNLTGCASGPGPAGFLAFFLALGFLALRSRRPTPARVRTSRRRHDR